jgi:hypothetical protein
VRRARGYGARSPGAIPPERLTVRVSAKVVFIGTRLLGMVGEKVVESARPGPETVCR